MSLFAKTMFIFRLYFFCFHAEDGIRDGHVTGVQTCALPIFGRERGRQDYYGHGTHVAGILNGSGLMSSGPGAFRTLRGLAPGAQLISLRALQPDGSGLTSDVISAIDWVVLHRRGQSI